MTDINEIRQGLEGTTAGPLRYEIQYGPEGEAYYAWLYRGTTMLTTIKTHDAISIVNAVNSIPALLSRLEEAERQRDEARAALEAAKPDIAGDNDGKEQDAFEAWAVSQRYDMREHPLHWLFMDKATAAARDGWRAGIRYARARALAKETAHD